MVNFCIVCKKDANPLYQRSFHRFPKNEVTYKRWVEAINVNKKIPQSARICSDHFKKSDFKNNDKYSPSVLKKNALPNTIICSNVSDIVESLDDNQMNNISNESIAKERSIMGLSRNDFISDSAWAKYRSNHNRLKTQIKITRRNIVKRDKTKQKMKQIIDVLKARANGDIPEFSSFRKKNMNIAEGSEQLDETNIDLKTTRKRKSNENGKKRKKRRKEYKMPDFPLRVPTIFRFNVNKRVDPKDFDSEDNYLYIESNAPVCCVCLKCSPPNNMQHIITGFDCNDFGRIFSIVLNLSESDICSPYCCTECSDKVLDCFNALLELNLAVCTSYRKRSSDRDVANKNDKPSLMCALCRTPQPSHHQLMDHMMLHAVEPLPVPPENLQVQPDSNNCATVETNGNENIEEGELLPLTGAVVDPGAGATSRPTSHPTARSLEEEHCYSISKSEPELHLCHICGEFKAGQKVLTRHLNIHYGVFNLLRSSKCSVCKIIITDRIEMHKHRREVHNMDDKLPKKLKKCRICGITFGTVITRNRHEQYEHFIEGYYSCPVCPKKLVFYDGILAHCRVKHPGMLSKSTVKLKEKKRTEDEHEWLWNAEEAAHCFVDDMNVGNYEEQVSTLP